jgi:HEPN domain-containing protein
LKEPNKEAERWLRQAEDDLSYAELGLRAGFCAQVCFQCQQICEKAIKALRYGRGERTVFGHALVELAASLEVLQEFRENLAILDQYYVPTRYPNGLPGGIPSDVYTPTQATEAVDAARRVVAAVRRELRRPTDRPHRPPLADADQAGST